MGANKEALDKYKWTPLHYAALYYKGNVQILAALVQAGANIEASNEYGFTPLHIAAEYGNLGVVEALIHMGQ
jgi:ankyrin repeat protein